MKSRAELDTAIDELAAWLPTMLAETDDSWKMKEFGLRAESLEDQAGADDTAYVHERLQGLLAEHCLVPSDEAPCA